MMCSSPTTSKRCGHMSSPGKGGSRETPEFASRAQHARGLGGLRGDEIHQRRRQAIVGLELQLSQPPPDLAHVVGACALFDQRRNESLELKRRPTLPVLPASVV